jgi:hypothetical protein
VQITLYYPGDMGKEFLADAKVILANLHFKSDKLPLSKNSHLGAKSEPVR